MKIGRPIRVDIELVSLKESGTSFTYDLFTRMGRWYLLEFSREWVLGRDEGTEIFSGDLMDRLGSPFPDSEKVAYILNREDGRGVRVMADSKIFRSIYEHW